MASSTMTESVVSDVFRESNAFSSVGPVSMLKVTSGSFTMTSESSILRMVARG